MVPRGGLLKLRVMEPAAVCGFVSVPLRHADAQSPRIRLAVVVIPALDKAARQPDPLFLAQGVTGSTIGGFAQACAGKAVLNVAASGKFSSDRTISEYAAQIWDVRPCPVDDAILREGREKSSGATRGMA